MIPYLVLIAKTALKRDFETVVWDFQGKTAPGPRPQNQPDRFWGLWLTDGHLINHILLTCSCKLYMTEEISVFTFHTSVLRYHMAVQKADVTFLIACDLRGVPYSFSSLPSTFFAYKRQPVSPPPPPTTTTTPITLPVFASLSRFVWWAVGATWFNR